jgi:hypothetical protein
MGWISVSQGLGTRRGGWSTAEFFRVGIRFGREVSLNVRVNEVISGDSDEFSAFSFRQGKLHSQNLSLISLWVIGFSSICV